MGGTYRDLAVWQKGMELVVEVYRCTGHFPADERFGLSNQLRRASVSIVSNVAEGKGRATDRDLLHFLSCARGSVYEVQTQLEIARTLGYLSLNEARKLYARANEVGRLINGLIKSLRRPDAA